MKITGFDKIKTVYHDSEKDLVIAAIKLNVTQIFKSNWFKHENQIHRLIK